MLTTGVSPGLVLMTTRRQLLAQSPRPLSCLCWRVACHWQPHWLRCWSPLPERQAVCQQRWMIELPLSPSLLPFLDRQKGLRCKTWAAFLQHVNLVVLLLLGDEPLELARPGQMDCLEQAGVGKWRTWLRPPRLLQLQLEVAAVWLL